MSSLFRWTVMRAASAACLAALARPAPAQQIPPPESGDAQVTVTFADQQVEVRDADSGAPIVMPRGIALFEPIEGSLTPEIQVNPQPTGFDVVYRFTNETGGPAPLPRFRLGVITAGNPILYRDFRDNCGTVPADYNDFGFGAYIYPANLYAPLMVLHGAAFSIGAALHYPVMEYKHDVRLIVRSPAGRYAEGDGGRGWEIEFRPSNVGNESDTTKLIYSALVPNGQSRTYVVSVRIVRPGSEWIRAFVPYRNFFRSEYGGVRYTRDPRAVHCVSLSNEMYVTPDNPEGWQNPATRPDLMGWEKLVSALLRETGWPRLMLWHPSGMYTYQMHHNPPYQFTTHWLDHPLLATAIVPEIGLPRIAAGGMELGLWWGRSTEFAWNWEPLLRVPFNPGSEGHVAGALAELATASAAGATMIGLDTFSHKVTPVWKLYPWLRGVRRTHPWIRFIAEPITNDIIHSIAPTYLRTVNDKEHPGSPEGMYLLHNPHYLADLILPGHETWGGFRYTRFEEYFGYTPGPDQVEIDMATIASYGYVPAIFYDMSLSRDYPAAESWLVTVPEDVRASDPPWGEKSFDDVD